MSAARLLAGIAIAGLALAGRALAGTPDAAAIARQGNGHGAAPCASCHGADGGGQPAAGFPRLAGLPAAYLLEQLDDFAAGTRRNATMQPVAAALSEPERQAMAAYYGKLPAPASPPAAAAAPADAALQAQGKALAERGRWSQGLPACEQCHGPGGVGVGQRFPPLAGQSAVYIANQLHAWRGGTRRNDPLQLMQAVAAKLSEADIAAVGAWYAAQPSTLGGGQQP